MTILVASALYAGGDIAPIETPAVIAETQDSGLYLGAGYSYTKVDASVGIISADDNLNAVTLVAGYKFCDYAAVEGRYSTSNTGNVFSDYDTNYDTYAIYAKPMYPVTSDIDVYALVGYANSDFVDESGFSYGAGALYTIAENIEVFVDYTVLADDVTYVATKAVDVKADAWTLGVNYRF